MLAQLPDERSEYGVKFLDLLIAKVEVIIGNTRLWLCLAQLFDVIDDS